MKIKHETKREKIKYQRETSENSARLENFVDLLYEPDKSKSFVLETKALSNLIIRVKLELVAEIILLFLIKKSHEKLTVKQQSDSIRLKLINLNKSVIRSVRGNKFVPTLSTKFFGQK